MLGGFVEGQHVITRTGLTSAFGYTSIRKGTRGCIVATPSGIFSDRYLVEFGCGQTLTVRRKDLRPALVGHGHDAWRRRQQTRLGIKLGLFAVFGLPALIGLAQYFLAGGSLAGLVAALPNAILDTAAQVMSILGLPLFLVLIAALWWKHRRR